jgi:hypothetical protein
MPPGPDSGAAIGAPDATAPDGGATSAPPSDAAPSSEASAADAASDGGAGAHDGGVTGAIDGGTCPVVGAPTIDAWIAFDAVSPDLSHQIYAVRPNGCELRQVTTDSALHEAPAFSPDGTELAFGASTGGGAIQVHVLTFATGAIRQVTSLAQGASQPAFSPDGKSIAFVSNYGTYVVDARTANAQPVLVAYGLNDLNPCDHPQFLGDGSIVSRCTYRIQAFSAMPGPTPPMQMGPSALRTIVQSSPVPEPVWPSIYPGGTLLAYLSTCATSHSTIFVAPLGSDTDTCSGTPVTSDADGDMEEVAFGPTMGAVNFAAAHGAPPRELVVVQSGAPASVHAIVPGTLFDVHNPVWSPIGTVLP